MNVLIVGAGPTGLSAALELARLGVNPVVVDKREQASSLSRAVGITPRSLQLLSESGVADRLISEGVAIEGLRVYRGQKLALSLPLHSDRMYFHTVLGLPQDRTEAIMSDTFTSLGGNVRYGVALEKLDNQGRGAVAQFSDGSSEHFDVVIGADGTRSTVRQEVGIEYPGIDLDQTWSIADVEANNWRHPNEIALILAGPGTVLVVAPMGKTRYRVVASQPDALAALPLPLDVHTLHREGSFRISVRQAQRYSEGCVHLAGDAAHCHSPVGGRGMNMGIADAVDLANRIVEGRTEDYSAIKHPEGAQTIIVTERGRRMTGGQTWPRRAALGSLLAMANLFGPVRRRLGRFLVEF